LRRHFAAPWQYDGDRGDAIAQLTAVATGGAFMGGGAMESISNFDAASYILGGVAAVVQGVPSRNPNPGPQTLTLTLTHPDPNSNCNCNPDPADHPRPRVALNWAETVCALSYRGESIPTCCGARVGRLHAAHAATEPACVVSDLYHC